MGITHSFRNFRSLTLMAAVALLLLTAFLIPPQASAAIKTVVTVGTSIEAGTWLNAGESWPSRLALRSSAISVTDNSLPGGAYTANTTSGDNIRLHVNQAIAMHPDIIVLGGPVNDLVRLSDVTPLRQAVFDAANAIQAAGIQVRVMGIIPFNDCAGCAFPEGWWPTLEPRRTTYNDWASAMYGNNFVDVTWCMHETYTWRGDKRFFLDGLHPSRVGAAMVAECFNLATLV